MRMLHPHCLKPTIYIFIFFLSESESDELEEENSLTKEVGRQKKFSTPRNSVLDVDPKMNQFFCVFLHFICFFFF